MPELPEVETIRLGLQQYVVGHTIEAIDVRLPKMVEGNVSLVTNAKVTKVRRFGKGLVIDLDNDHSIAIHIKMTGQLIYQGKKVPKGTKVSEKVGTSLPNLHTHVIFHLGSKVTRHSGKPKAHPESDPGQARMTNGEDDAVLYYNDVRRFGWIKIVKTKDVSDLPFFKGLGPEPSVVPLSGTMDGKPLLTLELFGEILHKGKGPIKPLLMDQKKIAGIGNIYANDALFVAKINPKRPANSLSEKEINTLFQAIETVLKKGLEVGGASEWQYVNALGAAGKYQNFFQVYGKRGRPCARCGTVIEKITMGGRGTFFCPRCQQ